MTAWIDTARVVAAANADGEFALQARLWNATITIANGADVIALTVAQGRVANAVANAAAAQVRISGPPSGWDEMLRPIPKPFYHDLRAAAAHHGFAIEGDLMHTAAYYPAIRRLIELLREVRNGTL